MPSRQAASTRPRPADAHAADGRATGPWWYGALAFAILAVVLWVVVGASAAWLPWSHPRTHLFAGSPWLEGWVHFDSGWYRDIANHGYSYVPGRQSSVAFFPAYPLAMRAGGALVGSTLLAGIMITLACGGAVAAMVWTWFRDRLSPPAAWTALALFLVYPYAFYLFGAVYADALYIAALLAAFVLLEADHLWLAGLAGALATAARPVGLVVVVGLVVRALERRGVFPRGRVDGGIGRGNGDAASEPAPGTPSPPLVDLRRIAWADSPILVSVAGLAAYSLYLGHRFGHYFLFADVERYWGQAAGPHTWLKVEFFKGVTRFGDPPSWVAYVAHPVVVILALAFVPRVFRRFGWGYGVFSLLAVGLAAFSTKDFFGSGRYVLSAFPCFAAAAGVLVDHPRIRAWTLGVSATGLLVMTSLFARGSYLS
jgi:hypothetical protein